MKQNPKLNLNLNSFFIIIVILLFSKVSFAQQSNVVAGTMEVGIARIDITPEGPIRLAGYGARAKSESEEVLQRLNAKAMAFGSDVQHPSILITVDLVAILCRISEKLT